MADLNKMEFDLNLIMKTDEIIKCWNHIKNLIDDDFILAHPRYDFEAFDAIDANIEDFRKEMEVCVVGEMKYCEGEAELRRIRDDIESIAGDQIETVSIKEDTISEKEKAQRALAEAFNNMRSKGAKIEQVFPQGE